MNMLLVASVLVAAGGAIAWLGGAERLVGNATPAVPGTETSAEKPLPISSAGSDRSDVNVVRGIGHVEPISEIRRPVFKVDGVTDTVAVSVGQQVAAGALLVSLRNQDEQAAVAEAEQQLSVAQAEREQLLAGMHPDQIEAARRRLDVLREQLRYANKHHQRTENLASKNASTEQDRDKTETDVRRIEKELRQAEAELAHLERQVREEDKHVAEALGEK